MPENSSPGQRFVQLIQQLGLSKNAFAQSLGKTATVIQHLVDERNKPGFDLLNRVLEVYPNVSSDWLLLGQGTMFRTPIPAELFADVVAPNVQVAAEAIDLASIAGPPRRRAPAASPLLQPADIAATVALAAQATHSPEAVAEEPAAPAPPAARPAEPPVAAAASVAAPTPAAPLPGPAPATAAPAAPLPDPAYLAALLQAQHLQHQLALAEQRNQHLLEQQTLLQQMVQLLQR